MRLSDLKDFLEGRMSTSALRMAMQAGLGEYERGALEAGRSMPVTLIEDVELLLSSTILLRLYTARLRGDLSDTELRYIADALLLSGSVAFAAHYLRETLEVVTDTESSKPLSEQELLDLITELSRDQ